MDSLAQNLLSPHHNRSLMRTGAAGIGQTDIMARPSKFTEKQWIEIENRVLAGESIRSLAKEFGVTESPIRARIKTHTKPVNSIARQLASAEIAMEKLSIKTQIKVRSLADDLKDISHHIASAARYGAITSHRLSMIANAQVDKIDDANPLGNMDVIKEIAVITELSNKSASTALNLMAANKEQNKKLNDIEDAEQTSIKRIERVIVNPANTNG